MNAMFDYLLDKMDEGLDFWNAFYATQKEYPEADGRKLMEMYANEEWK